MSFSMNRGFYILKSYRKPLRFAAHDEKVVAKIDLRSFYTNIRQNELYRALCEFEVVKNSKKGQTFKAESC